MNGGYLSVISHEWRYLSAISHEWGVSECDQWYDIDGTLYTGRCELTSLAVIVWNC